MRQIYIKKSTGEEEIFDRNKLRASLERASASFVLANEIADKIQSQIKRGDTTGRIYQSAFKILNKKTPKTAARYSLPRSIMELGPTGFPFEKYISKILDKKGYKTETNVTLRGRCVEHEIDIVAMDADDLIFIEAKFHNELGIKTDTKVALYVRARYEDLSSQTFNIDGLDRKMTRGTIITNTKFTDNAKAYSKCAGVPVIGWDYPEKGNLYELIESTSVFPITSLNTISKSDKITLLGLGVVDCAEVQNDPRLLGDIGIAEEKINTIISEIGSIL